MLSFPSQNDKKNFSNRPGVLKKQTQVTVNQHIFKSGPIKKNLFEYMNFLKKINYEKEFFVM